MGIKDHDPVNCMVNTRIDDFGKLLERIADRIDNIDERLTRMEIVQGNQEASITHHIRRTDIAEENTDILRQELELRTKELEARLKPLEDEEIQKAGMKKLMKYIVWGFSAIATIAGAVITVMKLLAVF